MRRIVYVIVLTIVSVGMLTGIFSSQLVKANPGIIHVPADYPTIQLAINNANTGDTILVSSGTYYESVIINKTVLLIGQDRQTTTVAASGSGDTIAVTVDGVLISNFTIGWGTNGIDFQNSNGNRIVNNLLKQCTNGATGSFYTGTLYENNIVTENTYGLNFGQLSGPSSINNTARNNEIYGNTQAGIYVSAANGNNTIIGNNIHDNNGAGIVLDHTQNNTVVNNTIRSNNYGIYLRNAIQNAIEANLIQGNNVALHFESSNGNEIFHNNFVSNPANVDGSSLNTWDNGYPSGGNYWSGYADNDLYSGPYQNITGSDGIGDVAYVIDASNTDRYPLMQQHPVPEFSGLLILPLIASVMLLISLFHRRNTNRKQKEES